MRAYYALVPWAKDEFSRHAVVIFPEVELIVRGVRAGVFCTDEAGVEIPSRKGSIGCQVVTDCWLTAAAKITESNDFASDLMYAEFAKTGRVALKADSLTELADQCEARLAQHLDGSPQVIRNAFAEPDPYAYLLPRVEALTDPGDVPGFAALKTWLVSICSRDPNAVVFPPGMRPVGGQIVPRYGALFAFKDLADTKQGTHFLRIAFALVDAAIYHSALEALR